MPKSERQRLHLEKLAGLKRGQVSPLKGRQLLPFSKEWKINISKGHIGQKAWNKGKECKQYGWGRKKGFIMSEEQKKKIIKSLKRTWDKKGRIGKGRPMNTIKYKKWRETVFIRDNWTCQRCKVRGGYLEAHHIKGWMPYPKLRYVLSNGITYCLKCHKTVDKFRN